MRCLTWTKYFRVSPEWKSRKVLNEIKMSLVLSDRRGREHDCKQSSDRWYTTLSLCLRLTHMWQKKKKKNPHHQLCQKLNCYNLLALHLLNPASLITAAIAVDTHCCCFDKCGCERFWDVDVCGQCESGADMPGMLFNAIWRLLSHAAAGTLTITHIAWHHSCWDWNHLRTTAMR